MKFSRGCSLGKLQALVINDVLQKTPETDARSVVFATFESLLKLPDAGRRGLFAVCGGTAVAGG